MTIRQLNNLVSKYCGRHKTDNDFTALVTLFSQYKLMLVDGDIRYSPDMTSKRYNYRIVEEVYNEEFDQIEEGKTVGYFTAMKCWNTTDLEEPFEVLAYVS